MLKNVQWHNVCVRNRIKEITGVPYPKDPVTKGEFNRAPFFYYPSQAKQSSDIAASAISPRNTDSVLT